MSSESRTTNCQEFQEQLPELIGNEELQNHPHYLSCERCRALMADLEAIAEAARQLLPVVDPPEELWAQIERAIEEEEAAVLPSPEKRPRIVFSRAWGCSNISFSMKCACSPRAASATDQVILSTTGETPSWSRVEIAKSEAVTRTSSPSFR